MIHKASRREFLHAAVNAPIALGLSGLFSLVNAREQTQDAVILLFMSGGPSSKATVNPDPPGTPEEYSGLLRPIATQTPGVYFSEPFPQLAARSRRLAVLRGLDTGSSDHTPSMETATLTTDSQRRRRTYMEIVGERSAEGAPAYCLLPLRRDWDGLVSAFRMNDAFAPHWSSTLQQFTPPERAGNAVELRLEERRALVNTIDKMSSLDTPATRRMVRFRENAFDLSLGGGKFFKALNLPESDLRRYGNTLAGRGALTAKRLVEAGAGAVAFYDERGAIAYDTHTNERGIMLDIGMKMDMAAAALIDDMEISRRRYSVVLMGEFNRSARITNGGREHNQSGNCAVLAGSGFEGGTVYGRTDRETTILDGRVEQRDVLANTIIAGLGGTIPASAVRVERILRNRR